MPEVWGPSEFSVAPLRRVGSQGIRLDPRKGREQMEARETGTGEERTARRPGGRGGGPKNTAHSPILRLKEVGGAGKKRVEVGTRRGGSRL